MSGATLPAGRQICPGWTSQYSPEQGIDHDGYASTYSAKKVSGVAVKHACGGTSVGRRRGEQAVISVGSDMCSRCRRQKTKFDDENGAKRIREERAAEQYRQLVATYVGDVREAFGGELPVDGFEAVVRALDGLVMRSEYPPFARRGEPEYRPLWNDRDVPSGHKLDVLRMLAGLELKRSRY